MSIKTDIVWRVGLIYLAIIAFGVFIAFKIIYLQMIDDEHWKQQAMDKLIIDDPIYPLRGDIYSDQIQMLASTVPRYEVRVDLLTSGMTDKLFQKHVGSFATSLAELFEGKSKEQYQAMLEGARNKGNRYLKIKSGINYADLKKLRAFPVFKQKEFKEGLIEIEVPIRDYPYDELARRTIGRTTKSPAGNILGIEGAFDTYLKGIEGVQKMQKLYGDAKMPIDEAGQIEARNGSSVVTTINVDMQDIAHKALVRQMDKFSAKAGTAVLMEVRTGDVKAIVNLTDTFGSYQEYYNYAVGRRSEPGSTFKLPALMTALEDGYVKLDDVISTGNGMYEYNGTPITDHNWEKGGFGDITVQEVFENSSNVGMVKIITGAYEYRENHFMNRLSNMDLDEPLGIPIRGEAKPVFHNPSDKSVWSKVTLSSMSYGYALELTPLQTLTFYNAVANNGRMVKPRFVTEIRYLGTTEKKFPTEVINPSICSKPTIDKAKLLLEGVVERGTAHNKKIDLVKVAGKTGTNRMWKRGVGYDKQSHQTSFVGYFPADKPKYSCIVIIYAPKGTDRTGSEVAAPVFFEIASKVYIKDISLHPAINEGDNHVYEVPYSKNGYQPEIANVLRSLDINMIYGDKDANWVATQKVDDHVELHPSNIEDDLIPNVVSMGLKDAVFLLENLGLNVEVVGRGSIRHQSIAAGSKVIRGETIKLEMSFTEG